MLFIHNNTVAITMNNNNNNNYYNNNNTFYLEGALLKAKVTLQREKNISIKQ